MIKWPSPKSIRKLVAELKPKSGSLGSYENNSVSQFHFPFTNHNYSFGSEHRIWVQKFFGTALLRMYRKENILLLELCSTFNNLDLKESKGIFFIYIL